MSEERSIGLSALGYCLPRASHSVEELARSARTTSAPDKLRYLGFGAVSIAETETSLDLARGAVDDLVRRSGFDLQKVDLIIYAAGVGTSHIVDPPPGYDAYHAHNPLPLFRFPGTRLALELGLPKVPVFGGSQLACSAFHGAVRMARALIASETDIEHVLCVAADKFPTEANREIVYNLMSDGACAGVVSRRTERNRIRAMRHVTRGVYWDGEASHDQLIAGFFPLVRDTILETVAHAGWTMADIDRLIPHNVNQKCWEIIGQMVGTPAERMYTKNIARIGHAVSSDNVINYLDAIDEGFVNPGDKVAWFVTGFGAHWTCMVLEA
ncbi:3-oxoacyl-[acyl-carrier-protein] synthase III C-terminal domain-containing protein [Pendulispora albinea]|uniref:3-oxoacyl-ACP synthase n=1 Tax=Pendulispora albinea TaxID=2741071 RepID=A0ABZ2LY67_9BACT